MTTQEFIAKYEVWFSYTRREELKKEMEADLESVFTALRQPPVMVRSEQLSCSNCGRSLEEHSKDSKLCPDRMKNFEQGNRP